MALKLKHRISMRLDPEQLQMIGDIIQIDPYKYDSISHILRVGLARLHRMEKQNETRRIENRRNKQENNSPNN